MVLKIGYSKSMRGLSCMAFSLLLLGICGCGTVPRRTPNTSAPPPPAPAAERGERRLGPTLERALVTFHGRFLKSKLPLEGSPLVRPRCRR